MSWIYLSPHLDDAALSCGGLVWEQARAGLPVSIWTLCAGDPPPGPLSAFAQILHARWQSGEQATQLRRDEDLASCQVLGANCRHFSLPDCIYRRDEETGAVLYDSEESLFYPLAPADLRLVETLAAELRQLLADTPADTPAEVQLVSPLTLGGHVDHRLARSVAEAVGCALWYYADYPYVVRQADALQQADLEGLEPVVFPVSEAGMQAWEAAIAAHASQISTFWDDNQAMGVAIRAYAAETGGVRLWRRPTQAT